MTLRPVPPTEPPFDPDYDQQPHDLIVAAQEAEHALLGALLLTPDRAADLLPLIEPTDFTAPAHELIWNTAADLYVDGTTPDIPTLIARTAGDPIMQRFGAHRLLELRPTDPLDTITLGQAESHAQIVRDAAAWRRVDTVLAEARRLHRTADRNTLHAKLERLGDVAHEAAASYGPRVADAAATGLADLSWILTGQVPEQPVPAWVTRTDGHALFYPAAVNGIFGDPESGKTWLAQAAVVEALHAGHTTAMIDVDHNGPNHTAARLILLGARPDHIADPTRFRYYEPEDADQLRAAVDDCTTRAPAVLIIDSIGEVFPMLGVSTNDSDEMTSALRLVCTRPAAAGSCVITIDHLPKSTEARSTGFAVGSIAKKRMIRGSYIRAEVRTQPAPGAIGRITLRIEKDTSGELRKTSGGGYAGTLTLDSTHDHITRWSIDRETAPVTADGQWRPTGVMEAVSRHIEQNDQCTFRDIKDAVAAKDKTLRTAIQLLADEGFITQIQGPRNSKLHHAISLYREAEDDHI